MGNVLWNMSAAGEMRPLWGVQGVWCVTREGAQGLCQLACTGQGFSFDRRGEPQVTPAIDGLDERRMIF